MLGIVLEVKNLSKEYRLGVIGRGTLREDFQSWWAKVRGKEDPNSLLTEAWEDQGATIKNGHLCVLKDISFQVKQGEVLGIIGVNGAGKSTLLKIISKITQPSSGLVRAKGRIASLLEVGTGFHPELTGRENIFLNGAILGMNKAEVSSKLDEIIDFSGIEKFINTPVKRYSSGMYVRLAFAVAAHLEPEILIIDEVLAVGDIQFQKKCLGKMKDVSSEGRTVLFVSHNITAIRKLCERTILLAKGEVHFEGSTEKAIKKYQAISFGGKTEGAYVQWNDLEKAPGDETVRLLEVGIYQKNISDPMENVDVSHDIIVRFRYKNLKRGNRLYTSLHLFTTSSESVFASGNHVGVSLTDDAFYNVPLDIGEYEVECIIPKYFLNEGVYCVTPILGHPISNTICLLRDCLQFEVRDYGSVFRTEYMGGYLGIVRPRLAWKTMAVVS